MRALPLDRMRQLITATACGHGPASLWETGRGYVRDGACGSAEVPS